MRDINKEQKKIRNGNRYILDEDGTGVFSRDVDRLFREYTNLRKKIYNTEKHKFQDPATRDELSSYIDEEFVKLVKEYEINSPVDFPGYIKAKLNLRVRNVFVKSKFRDKNRERLTSNEWDIKNLLDYQQLDEFNSEVHEELTYFMKDETTLDDLQKSIIIIWMSGVLEPKKVATQLMKIYDVTRKEADEDIQDLRDYLAPILEKYVRKKDEES